MVKMGSPSKDKDAFQHSRKLLKSTQDNPVLHNHVRGYEPVYDQMWEDSLHNKNGSFGKISTFREQSNSD